MPAPLRQYGDNEFSIFIETNQVIPSRLTLDFFREIERIASVRKTFGPDAILELVELRTGSQFSFWRVLEVAAAAAGVATFLMNFETASSDPNSSLSKCIARVQKRGAVELTVTGRTCQLTLDADRLNLTVDAEPSTGGSLDQSFSVSQNVNDPAVTTETPPDLNSDIAPQSKDKIRGIADDISSLITTINRPIKVLAGEIVKVERGLVFRAMSGTKYNLKIPSDRSVVPVPGPVLIQGEEEIGPTGRRTLYVQSVRPLDRA